MSTELRDSDCPETYGPHSLYTWGDGSVNLTARSESAEIVATMDRAEFIKAVGTELNVTVIDKPLPTAHVNAVTKTAYVDASAFIGIEGIDPEWLAATGLRYLAAARALAEYRDAHPPADEAQVDAWRTLLLAEDETLTGTQVDNLARRLVEKGVRV